ncbi:g13518 [Coccomyxa viridis]|uniref:G13518 protein n=1 Tax=Coccomyxa viridis TaxID=1274662 RepID=A0ABP1GFL2_9CHLO
MALVEVLLDSMPGVLLLYWSLCTLAAVIALFPSLGWSGFRNAVKLSACRGKLWSGKPDAPLGPLQAARVPQKWFAHFYAIGVLCAVTALWLLFAVDLPVAQGSKGSQAALLGMLCLLLHLARRLVESTCLMSYPEDAFMHLIAYFFGVSYYIALPLTLLPSSAWQRLQSHMVQLRLLDGRDIAALLEAVGVRLTMTQAVGVLVFFAGNALQCHSHWILARLRATIAGKRGDHLQTTADGYAVPEGGAFTLVSCPHYLGEIVIYFGLALILGDSNVCIWIVLAWVVSNLMLAAGPTHQWYKQNFAAYPSQRRALIPWVY